MRTTLATEEYESSALTLSVVGQRNGLFGRVSLAYYRIETTTRTGLVRGGIFSGAGFTDCSVSSVASTYAALR